MQKLLNTYLSQDATPVDFKIQYHIGDDFSGETAFQLQGDGHFELWSTATDGRQRRTYAGQIERSQVKALTESLLENHLWQVGHIQPRPGEDDPEASITVSGGSDQYRVVLWITEIKKVPAFAQAQAEILTLVRELSHGEILEGGN